jgi:pSer/pThr/pTyr-binding forkhead associated (FHA) protein
MNVYLVVLTQGKMEGKHIPVASPQFLIGRDAQCHLRPTSAWVSKRHCAVLIEGDKVLIRDLDSTNGTLVNAKPVQGVRELQDGDKLKVGPLEFRIALVTEPAIKEPTPAPASPGSIDEAAATLLLSVEDKGPAASDGSTIREPAQVAPDSEAPANQKQEQDC